MLVTLDAGSGKILSVGPLSGGPDVVWFNAKRRQLYVAVGDPGVIDVFDTNSMQSLGSIVTEKGAHTTAFPPSGDRSTPSCRPAIARRSIKRGVTMIADCCVLSRSDVARLMDFPAYVDAVEAGFRAAAGGQALAPPAAGFARAGRILPRQGRGAAGGRPPVVAIKLNANFPGNPASQRAADGAGRDLPRRRRATAGRWR